MFKPYARVHNPCANVCITLGCTMNRIERMEWVASGIERTRAELDLVPQLIPDLAAIVVDYVATLGDQYDAKRCATKVGDARPPPGFGRPTGDASFVISQVCCTPRSDLLPPNRACTHHVFYTRGCMKGHTHVRCMQAIARMYIDEGTFFVPSHVSRVISHLGWCVPQTAFGWDDWEQHTRTATTSA